MSIHAHGAANSGPLLIHHRVGGWLPKDHKVLEKWLSRNIAEVESKGSRALHPVIQDFQRLIDEDAIIYMGFHQMFEQVPAKPPYNNDPTGKPQVRVCSSAYHGCGRLTSIISSRFVTTS
jgi:phosphatidylserine decarboxylase